MEKNRPSELTAELNPGVSSDLKSSPHGNPWIGFAHPEHQEAEYESLLRTLRFASIQLNRFWVEVSAFPVFMNEMKGASLRQIERLFDWFQAAPSWSAKVTQSRLVPELVQEASRKALLDFTSRVVRARALRARLAQSLRADWTASASFEAAVAKAAEASALARGLGLEQGTLVEAEARIRELSVRLERNGRLQDFFARLATECRLGGEASRLREALRVFQAAEIVRHAPLSVWHWRKLPVMATQNRARILAWQEKSEPLVAARKRLEPRFRMSERVAAAQLRLLAEKIEGAGLFRALSSEFKDAVKRYQELLRTDKDGKPLKAPKESPAEMAEQLNDWATYLERKAQVEDAAEAKALFGKHFRGIDTDYVAALEANAWATSVRTELESEDKGEEADFCTRLADALFETPQEKLLQAANLCSGASMQAIQAILAQPDYAADRDFAQVACEDETRWMQSTRLRDLLTSLGAKPSLKLEDLPAIGAAVTDLRGLIESIDAMPEPKAAFKQAYAGEQTDLGLLAAAQDYIDFVNEAGLSEGLRASFLTSAGPQRLQDTRKLVAPALAGMTHVKEHFRRLEVATHGQSRSLEDLPLLDLIQRIGVALKKPQLLGESVQALRAPRTLQ